MINVEQVDKKKKSKHTPEIYLLHNKTRKCFFLFFLPLGEAAVNLHPRTHREAVIYKYKQFKSEHSL